MKLLSLWKKFPAPACGHIPSQYLKRRRALPKLRPSLGVGLENPWKRMVNKLSGSKKDVEGVESPICFCEAHAYTFQISTNLTVGKVTIEHFPDCYYPVRVGGTPTFGPLPSGSIPKGTIVSMSVYCLRVRRLDRFSGRNHIQERRRTIV